MTPHLSPHEELDSLTPARAQCPDPFTAVEPGQRRAVYRQLAAEGRPKRIRTPEGAPAWLVTSHAQIRQVLTDTRLVKAESPSTVLTRRLVPELSSALTTHMLRFEPPDHTRLRRLVGSVFTRRRVEQLAPRIRQITDDLLDELDRSSGPDHPVDLVPEYAFPLPMRVICEMIGLPEQRRADFRNWSMTLVAGYFSDTGAFIKAATDLLDCVRELITGKRRQPGDDLLSELANVGGAGDRLSEDELTSMVWLLVIAGHETTVNLIASGVHALLTHPDQLTLLLDDPDLIDTAIEEILRMGGSLHAAIPLRVTEPIELAGVSMSTGEIVIPALMAANHDTARFADPDTFDITRADNPHAAFGHGIHYCLGAPLARLEARIGLSSLLARFPDLRLAVPPDRLRWRQNFLVHGLTALPVTLR